MIKSVADVLDHKGTTVFTIEPHRSVYEAIELMANKSIGSVLVKDGDKVAGIITERDYARKVILKGRASKQTQVREVMTDRVISVHSDQPVEECLALMTERRIRHLPVVDQKEEVIGLISVGDVIKAMIADKQFEIDQLYRYISGY